MDVISRRAKEKNSEKNILQATMYFQLGLKSFLKIFQPAMLDFFLKQMYYIIT